MSTQAHTPTPWKVRVSGGRVNPSVAGPNGESVASCKAKYRTRECREEATANAAHIVKCVNAHNQIVALVQGFDQHFSREHPDGPDSLGGSGVRALWLEARAVLAKAQS